MCSTCKYRQDCVHPCRKLLANLPDPNQGRMCFHGRNSQEVLAHICARRALTVRIISGRHMLSGKMRIIFDFYFNNALSQEKIALKTGLSRSTVRTYLERAFRKIAATG